MTAVTVSPKDGAAAAYIRATLMDVLPPGVPPSFTEIISARYEGTGRSRIARASLRMTDGHVSVVEAWDARGLRGHRWDHQGQTAIYWTGRAWAREAISPTTQEADHAE